jgi:hypothetical protein
MQVLTSTIVDRFDDYGVLEGIVVEGERESTIYWVENASGRRVSRFTTADRACSIAELLAERDFSMKSRFSRQGTNFQTWLK